MLINLVFMRQSDRVLVGLRHGKLQSLLDECCVGPSSRAIAARSCDLLSAKISVVVNFVVIITVITIYDGSMLVIIIVYHEF